MPNFPVGTKFVRVLAFINYASSANEVTRIDHVTLRRLNYGPLFVGNNFNATNMNDQSQVTQMYTTSANNLIITPPSSGNVGIGTTGPGGTLEIADENGGQQMLRVRNYATGSTGVFTGNYVAEFRSAYTAGAVGGALLAHTQESSDSRPTMQVSDAGGIFATFVNQKVGIGTTGTKPKVRSRWKYIS